MSIANAEIQNLLTKEMILFMKQILNNFDEFLACTYVRVHTRSRELIPSLIRIGYDGSISSVIYNNEFWDTIMFGILDNWQVFDQLQHYNFTFLEKTLDEIIPYLNEDRAKELDMYLENDLESDYRGSVSMIVMDYLINNWTTRLKEPLKIWALIELCPK